MDPKAALGGVKGAVQKVDPVVKVEGQRVDPAGQAVKDVVRKVGPADQVVPAEKGEDRKADRVVLADLDSVARMGDAARVGEWVAFAQQPKCWSRLVFRRKPSVSANWVSRFHRMKAAPKADLPADEMEPAPEDQDVQGLTDRAQMASVDVQGLQAMARVKAAHRGAMVSAAATVRAVLRKFAPGWSGFRMNCAV